MNPMLVYGLISQEEGLFLQDLAASVKTGGIVEIGPFLGRSTLFLAEGNSSAPIFTIEPFAAHDWIPPEYGPLRSREGMRRMLRKNVAGAANVRVLPGACRDIPLEWIPPEGIALLVHDGNHDWGSVYEDVRRFLPFLRWDATIVYHDFERPGHEGVKVGIERLWPDWERRVVGRKEWMLALSAYAETPTFEQIDARCPGWSTPFHQRFFRWLLTEKAPEIAHVLILGVYRGRDLAYLAKILKERERPYRLAGVDLFAAAPCADWTEEQRALQTWEAAYNVPPPSREAAWENLARLGLQEEVHLFQGDAVSFLELCNQEWDLIYIDTSHDEATVRATIRAAVPCLRNGGYLAGDDCIDDGTWGVVSAVNKSFRQWQKIQWAGIKVQDGAAPEGTVRINPLWLARKEDFAG